MKSFMKKRSIPAETARKLSLGDRERGGFLAETLQGGLAAISLSADPSVTSAISNDMGEGLVFAQQVLSLGRQGDVLLAISTSGNAENVINAAVTAAAVGMKVVGLTGRTGGSLSGFCDILIAVPADATHEVQELHLPVYHTLCAMAEDCFF